MGANGDLPRKAQFASGVRPGRWSVSRRASWLTGGLTLTLTLALVACGGAGDRGGNADPEQLLDSAFANPIPTSITEATVVAQVEGLKGLPGALELRVEGPYVSGKGQEIPSVDWAVDVAAGALGLTGELVSTGDNVFVVLGGEPYEVGRRPVARQNRQVRAATRAAGGTPKPLTNLGIHPRDWFRDPSVVGEEVVDDVETVHVTAGLDAPQVVEDGHEVANNLGLAGPEPAPTRLSPDQAGSVKRQIERGSIDAWIGIDDEVVRRFRVELAFAVAPAQRNEVGGARSGTVILDILQLEVGEEQTVEGPSRGRPIAEIVDALPGIPGLEQ